MADLTADALPPNAHTGGGGVAPVVAPITGAEREKAAVTPPGDVPFTGAALWGVGVLLAFANFIALLDSTITNVSVPNIAGGLAVSPSEGTWTITSYSVAEAITVPLTGWLAQRFGTVRVFCTAMALFGVFSFCCGFASSLNMLIFFRICQGLAGGPMIPLSQTLLLRIFPKHQAPQALALWSMTTVVAPIAGPLLGGSICDNISWPWIFYINVPFALGAAALAWRVLISKETPGRKLKLDTVGLGLLVLWISAMQVMLDKGKELDWFNSPLILTLLIVAVIGFCAFLIWEVTAENPVVNLRVFRHRSFATACTVMALAFGCFFANNVILPLWLQTNMGYTATWAGRATAWGGVLAVIMSPVVGRLVGKVDSRLLVMFGICWMAFTLWLRAHFASNVDYWHIALPQFLQGFGVPFFFIPLMSLGTAALPVEETASGAGLISFVRTTAGAFGVSIATTAWEDAGQSERVNILNQGGGFDHAIAALRATGLTAQQAARQFEAVVQQQATMAGTDKIFMTIAIMMVFAAFSVWIAPKPPKRAAGPPGGGH